MDYSSNDCQNSFTLGQIGVMRVVLEDYRTNLAEVSSMVATEEVESVQIALYPNPTAGSFTLSGLQANSTIQIFSLDGKLVFSKAIINEGNAEIELKQTAGVYLVHVTNTNGYTQIMRVVISE